MEILVADDHALVRAGIRSLLQSIPGFEVVGEASDGAEVLRRAEEERWDVLVLDLTMPKTDGLEVLRCVRKLRPTLPVLILSMYAADPYAARLLRTGASGYLSKGCSSAELNVSASTVSTHIARIRQQLGAQTLGEIVRYASRFGVV